MSADALHTEPAVAPAPHLPTAPRAARLLLLAGCLAALAHAAYRVLYAPSYYDEGGYLYEGWLTCARGWVPFRDFNMRLPPLVQYWYGVPQALFGPSMLLGRLTAVLASCLALLVAVRVARRLGGAWAPVLLVWLVAVSDRGLDKNVLALTCPLVSLWLMLMVWGALTPWRWGRHVLGLAAGLLLLTRHDMAPLVLSALAYPRLAGRPWRDCLPGVALCAVVFALGVVPYAAIAPGKVLHVMTFGAYPRSGDAPYLGEPNWSLRVVRGYVRMMGRQYLGAGALVLVAMGVGAWWRRRSGYQSTVPDRAARAPFVLLGTIVVLNPLLHALAGVCLEFHAFYLADYYIWMPLLTLAAAAYGHVCGHAGATSGLRRWGQLLVAGAVGLLLVQALLTAASQRPPGGHPDLQRIRRGGRVIAANVPPDALVFTLTQPQELLAAQRIVFPPLTWELFSYRETADTSKLDPRFTYNLDIIHRWLRSQADYAVLSSDALDYIAGGERYARGYKILDAVNEELRHGYVLVAQADNTYEGRMYVYKRVRSGAEHPPEGHGRDQQLERKQRR